MDKKEESEISDVSDVSDSEESSTPLWAWIALAIGLLILGASLVYAIVKGPEAFIKFFTDIIQGLLRGT